MASGDRDVPYGDLNIGGQVVSTLHGRPHQSTHFNTIRAQYRAHTGKTTKPYITTSRNRIHQMRNTGNIVPLEKGHMRLSPQARKTMNIVVSQPGLTKKQRAKCVNALAGVFTRRPITRDLSVLEVAATVTGSTLSSGSSRQPARRNRPQEPIAGPLTPEDATEQSTMMFLEIPDEESSVVVEEPQLPVTPLVGKPGPSRRGPVSRTITRHGTEVFCGLVTPVKTPVKASGNRPVSPVFEQDTEMDNTEMACDDIPSSPTPGSAPQNADSRSALVSALTREVEDLRRERQYVIKRLSRNGQGTLSNIETVTDRAVRQREELRVENQQLRAVIEHLESGIANLQDRIARMQDILERAQGEHVEIVQSRRRWIARMWALAGRVPGELRKKEAEIENMKGKLEGMHAQLAMEQAQLRERQEELQGERTRRIGVEAELDGAKTAHAREMKDRDQAGRRLRDQLKQITDDLDYGAVSI